MLIQMYYILSYVISMSAIAARCGTAKNLMSTHCDVGGWGGLQTPAENRPHTNGNAEALLAMRDGMELKIRL